MKKAKQLKLFVDNQPGVLSRICNVLEKRKVNIIGISITDGHDHTIIRMVVDRSSEAIHCLGSAGILVVENDVLLVDIPNNAGALGDLARKLAKQNLNIEYSYCTADSAAGRAKLVLRVDNPKKALVVLKTLFKSKK